MKKWKEINIVDKDHLLPSPLENGLKDFKIKKKTRDKWLQQKLKMTKIL
jgi:hypothetical protein